MHTHDDLGTLARGPKSAALEPDSLGPDVSRVAHAGGPMSPASVLELQRLAGNATVSRLLAPEEEADAGAAARSPVLEVVGQGGGQPLEPGLRGEMESSMGADFGDVRIHTDAHASDSARSVRANAYTVGQDVVFRSDRWAPDTAEGKRTLAHELTHVVQQSAGPVAGTEAPGGIRQSDPADEFEQGSDATADAVMAGVRPSSVAGGTTTASAQRQPAEEELEQLQASYVKRQDDDEKPEEAKKGVAKAGTELAERLRPEDKAKIQAGAIDPLRFLLPAVGEKPAGMLAAALQGIAPLINGVPAIGNTKEYLFDAANQVKIASNSLLASEDPAGAKVEAISFLSGDVGRAMAIAAAIREMPPPKEGENRPYDPSVASTLESGVVEPLRFAVRELQADKPDFDIMLARTESVERLLSGIESVPDPVKKQLRELAGSVTVHLNLVLAAKGDKTLTLQRARGGISVAIAILGALAGSDTPDAEPAAPTG